MYDEEIEKTILYYIIFKKEQFDVLEKDFVIDRNKKLIKVINQMKQNDEEISMLTVANKFKTYKTDVLKYIANLDGFMYGISSETAYNRLIDLSKKRQVYELMHKENEEEYTDVFIEKIIKELQNIQNRNEKQIDFKDQVIETMQEIENNYQKRNDRGLYTGIRGLDNKLLGLHNKELTILGARPGVGKTTMALQIAQNLAKKGKHICIISLEMAETQIIQKILSKYSNVNGYKLRSGFLTEEDFEKLAQTSSFLLDLPLHITTKCRTIQQIEIETRKMKNKGILDVLIIDYIQLIKNNGRFNSREQQVADISRTLKLLTLELDIPIIALCQLNRNATKNEPTLADLRESGSLEQDADNVIFLYQEKEDDSLKPDVTLKIAKQRAGELGKVNLIFNKMNSEFISLEE